MRQRTGLDFLPPATDAANALLEPDSPLATYGAISAVAAVAGAVAGIVDPRLQGTAWGLFSFLVKAMAVVVLLVVPHVVAATSWQAWLGVTVVCMALFGVAICFFGGPWRRPAAAAEEPATAAGVRT
ncbi:hypothetical protein [Pseudonocardia nigra]|uniref:hypothetical protein n=1 Tax=Pseudonocardia nigra TaxID=1921578 RepID=UPI001C5EBC5B|nr:hypothetical protein [Pseudonocardia nigra]